MVVVYCRLDFGRAVVERFLKETDWLQCQARLFGLVLSWEGNLKRKEKMDARLPLLVHLLLASCLPWPVISQDFQQGPGQQQGPGLDPVGPMVSHTSTCMQSWRTKDQQADDDHDARIGSTRIVRFYNSPVLGAGVRLINTIYTRDYGVLEQRSSQRFLLNLSLLNSTTAQRLHVHYFAQCSP